MEKSEENKMILRLRDRCKHNIKMALKGNKIGRCGLDSSCPGEGQVASSCEHDYKHMSFIKCGDIFNS